MAKLVYAVDSNSTPEMVVGSSPTLDTICARGEIGKHMRFKLSRLRVLRVRVPPGARNRQVIKLLHITPCGINQDEE